MSSALNVYKTATGAEVTEGTLLGTLAYLAGNAYGNDGTLDVGASETFDIVIEMPVPSATSIRTAASPSICA